MNLSLHQPSFWVGFITGIFFFWLLQKILPFLLPIWQNFISRLSKAREGISAGVEVRFRHDILKFAQKQHILAPLYSLDEILITPYLLVPPPEINPDDQAPLGITASYTLPFMPDWPELGSNFNAPKLTITEILQGDKNCVSNFAIIGNPGIGKTFALSHLASMVARRQPETGILANLLPILVHAANLEFNGNNQFNPIDDLVNALSISMSAFTQPRLPRLLKQAFNEGRVLLLIDGVDEIPPKDVDQVVAYLSNLMDLYPRTRILVAASNDYHGGLVDLGFTPIPLCTWNEFQRRNFIDKWTRLWNKHFDEDNPDTHNRIEQQLIKNWLHDENAAFTPLEFTLKVWAAFAGDSIGPSAADAIEAYIRRITYNTPDTLIALEEAAFHMLSSHQFVFNQKQFGKSAALENLINSGFINRHTHAHFSIVNTEIAGYLAASVLAKTNTSEIIASSSSWAIIETTAYFYALFADISRLATTYLAETDNPLLTNPFKVARWLRHTPHDAAWKSSTLRYMSDLLQRDMYSLGLRGRAVTALATSGVSGVKILFKQMLTSSFEDTRLLGIFGLGLLREKQLIPEIETKISDPSPIVSRASVLALYSIGTDKALEGIASALLHGSEDVRRTAAEAFANHPKEGYATLKDGSQNDDLMVRRAVVYGLIQVERPWAENLLKKMAVEDGQWVVRNAAAQALEFINSPSPYLPENFPADSDNPRLIEYAGRQGLGLTPGKSAADLIVQMLRTGNDEQRLAALARLRRYMDSRMIPEIYSILFGSSGELRESAFNTLWYMSCAGIKLPSPTQFGLG
jgi:HEAT repeat protein